MLLLSVQNLYDHIHSRDWCLNGMYVGKRNSQATGIARGYPVSLRTAYLPHVARENPVVQQQQNQVKDQTATRGNGATTHCCDVARGPGSRSKLTGSWPGLRG